jgi:aldehyde:ferredoxin oxidoreductase
VPYGWMGKTLEIDLTEGTIEKKETDPEFTRLYLGGKGTNTRIFWERVLPETGPFSSENLLIIDTSVLTGTIVPSANRAVITCKSPVNGHLVHTVLGGFWAPAIKHAGYDTIIIRGKSSVPVYLWINDDDVQLRDATHLWGKGTPDTMQTIRAELENDAVQIACIGPAGENRCAFASIESAVGSSASRGGAGAVMGDKNLKAIAAYGTRDVRIAKPLRLVELCEGIKERSGPLNAIMAEMETPGVVAFEKETLIYGNMNERYVDMPADSSFKKALDKLTEPEAEWLQKPAGRGSCHNCGIKCRLGYAHPGGGISYLKCEAWFAYWMCKILNYDDVLECHRLTLHYGFDHTGLVRTIAFAIDLYEKGILTTADTDGMPLEYGNKELFCTLVDKIGRREGFGAILANGVHEAARQIGRGAEAHVHQTKKLDYHGTLMYAFRPYLALGSAIAVKSVAAISNFYAVFQYMYSKEEREAVTNSPYWNYPEDFKKYYLAEPSFDGTDYEALCQFVAYDADRYTILDMTGICSWWAGFNGEPPIHTRELMAELVACVTGLDIDEAELTAIAGRVLSLERALNTRLGLSRKDDSIAKKFFELPPVPAFNYKGHDPDLFEKWIDRYYELKGWNRDGVPTRERLQELGLDDVAQDLKQRGFLKA